MADLTLNGEPIISLNLHLPMNGAWSAEVQVASDTELATDDLVTLALPDLELIGRVVRAGVVGDRLRARVAGGEVDWTEAQAPKHYKTTAVDQVLEDVDLDLDQADGTQLDFWSRETGTTGSTIQAIAQHLGHNWRVNPDATIRMRAESPAAVDMTNVLEITRDPARGLVECAVDSAVLLPGVLAGDDEVGDVLYMQDGESNLRVRYYTEARARLRGALERLVRWVMRDTLFLGQYTAEVVRQAGDGTLDLMPDDDRLRSQGLQSVPIRHGLPGVTVEVPAGERVLLAFDAGDPSKPFAALWHAGQVTRVSIGGEEFVALASLVEARLANMQTVIDTHMHPTAGVGAPSPPTPPIVWPTDPMASAILKTG